MILFLTLVYIPIFLNMFFVYSRTINITKEEKTETLHQILVKTHDTLELTLKNISRITSEASTHNALRKAVQDFDGYSTYQKDMLVKFYRKELQDLEKNIFIDCVLCLSKDGQIVFSSENYQTTPGIQINEGEFISSRMLIDFAGSKRLEQWNYVDEDSFICRVDNKELIYIIQKLKGVGSESGRTVNREDDVGYLVSVINSEALRSVVGNTNLTVSGEMCFYNRELKPVLTNPVHPIQNLVWENLINTNNKGQSEILINKELCAIEAIHVEALDWYIVSVVPVKELVGPISHALRSNFWLIALVSAGVAIWIIIEILLLSKLATQKEMSEYRLLLSQENNEKLRIYKHDFMNHLQIIQGLIQMEKPDRALEYLYKVTEEGKVLGSKYEIGVPELESAIFSSIAQAQENNIEVKIDSIKLPQPINLDIYDISKIMVNLIKNAMYALINAEAEEKVITIKIYEALDEYVFSVSNNVPLIPMELRDRIFEKGFTTKAVKGNGLGLYIVKKLAHKNGGEVELKVDEEGNHFIVRFPQKA